MYCVSETSLEVRYYETDLMGIVHHSNYIRYFECGRHQCLIDLGLPIYEIEKRGIMMQDTGQDGGHPADCEPYREGADGPCGSADGYL